MGSLLNFSYNDYKSLCNSLKINPTEAQFDAVKRYMSSNEVVCEINNEKFSIYLENILINKFNIPLYDFSTKIFIKNHKIRFVLNAIVAVHECNKNSFLEMISRDDYVFYWLKLILFPFKLLIYFLLSMLWILFHYLRYKALGFLTFHDFSGKTFLITGAGGTIAQDLILRLSGGDVRVICVYHTKQPSLILPDNAILIRSDLSSVDDLIAKLNDLSITPNDIDVTIWCAGVKYNNGLSLKHEILIKTFNVNTFSPVKFYEWFGVNHMGHFLVVSSLGRYHGYPGTNGYNASKAGLSILFESINIENQIYNIKAKVSIIEPGLVMTAMTSNSAAERLLSVRPFYVTSKILKSFGKKSLFVKFPSSFRVFLLLLMLAGSELRSKIIIKLKQ